ncbi:MAG: DUF6516 family protein [Promethearchaeota archaeon]
MIEERLQKFAQIVEEEFSDIIKSKPLVIETKLRIFLIDGSFIDVRYPIDTDYSFHWERKGDITRVNTAPDHPEVKTFPRHIHQGESVKEDTITDLSLSPEENLRRFFNFVKESIMKK